MHRLFLIIGITLLTIHGFAQRHLSRQEAVLLAKANRINTDPAQLELLQQQQLLRSAQGFDNPELEYEIDPYDPTVLGVLMPLRFPTVYASRRNFQRARVRLSELMLSLNQYEISRLVQNTYTEVQYLFAKLDLLKQQDSLYQSIKKAAIRNFEAGQINKLEELFASNEANNVHNELERTVIELSGQKQALAYVLNLKEDVTVDSLQPIDSDSLLLIGTDTLPSAIRPQIFQQQVIVSRRQLKAEQAELLPSVTTGPLFGLQEKGEERRRLGVRVGISIPLWMGQNKARIRAAQTGIQLAEAQQQRELRDFRSTYSTTVAQVLRELQSLHYYTSVANQQAAAITTTAIRLFEAGQVNYIETLRNIITAYQTKTAYLETIRNLNQAVIELNCLNGTL